LESSCDVGNKQTIHIWSGKGFFVKVYQDPDQTFNAVIHTPDFDTENEAMRYVETFIQGVIREPKL
jgi:hypothetical protein